MSLFHVTCPCRIASIKRAGLVPGFDGVVYLGSDPQWVGNMMWDRLAVHFLLDQEPIIIKLADGTEQSVPAHTRHEFIHLIEIDQEKLDQEKLAVSTDHNPDFYGPGDSWAYAGIVAPSAFLSVSDIAPISNGATA